MKPYILQVTYHTKPGQREAYLRQLVREGLVTAVRNEDGCQRYDYYLSVQDADELLLVEQWASPAHQAAHMRQPHMVRMMEIKAQFVEETLVQEMEERP